MIWTEEAQRALNRAPFFVRGIARRKTEEHVRSQGRDTVTLDDVTAAKRAFRGAQGEGSVGDPPMDPQAIEQLVANLAIESEKAGCETPGYVFRVCAGAVGCPRALVELASLRDKVLAILEEADLESVLRSRHSGPLLRHHKFRVSLAACTNACSEPQTKDFGVIGQAVPTTTDHPCDLCRRCVAACQDGAIELGATGPTVDTDVCSRCGDCVRVCPSGHLAHGPTGYRILLGGRLGRRPRLATAVAELASEAEVLDALREALRVFIEECRPGERFAEVLDRVRHTDPACDAGSTYTRVAVTRSESDNHRED